MKTRDCKNCLYYDNMYVKVVGTYDKKKITVCLVSNKEFDIEDEITQKIKAKECVFYTELGE